MTDTGPEAGAAAPVSGETPAGATEPAGGARAAGADCHTQAPGYHEKRSKYLARLRRIEGQVRGIHRMIDEDTYCIDVLTQISAVTKALESVSLALVEDHVHHCVHDAVASGDPETIDEKLDEVLAAMRRMMR